MSISSLIAIMTAIAAIIAAYIAHRLASLAIARVSASRASRLADD